MQSQIKDKMFTVLEKYQQILIKEKMKTVPENDFFFFTV